MIYVVEDDAGIREMMVYTLNSTGNEAAGFEGAKQLDAAIKQRLPELIMLDIMLPGEDGISILKRLRADPKTRALPIIMASAKSTEFDKVSGLDLGADMYLTKPFGMMEMVSAVRAVLRRTGGQKSDEELTLGKIVLNTARRTVFSDGASVNLTLKEFELLKLMMENPKLVFTRDMLLSRVWGDDYYGESRTVDVHIRTLRAKLGSCAANVKTLRGVGYFMEEDS